MIRLPAALVVAFALLMPAVALGHVEVTSGGGDLVIVTVPNESASADTVEVAVQLPDSALQVELPKVAGWTAVGETEPLDPPLLIGGTRVTERVVRVIWNGGAIAPRESAEFRLRVRVRAGTPRAGLPFPAVQRYDDGSVVRWIGPAGSEHPAGVLTTSLPVIEATPAPDTSTDPPASTAPSVVPGGATTGAEPADTNSDEGAPTALLIGIGVIVIVGGAIFGVIRKRRGGASDA